MKKKYHIHPISNFNHTAFRHEKSWNWKDGYINLSNEFWWYLFDKKILEDQYIAIKKNFPNTKYQQYWHENIWYFLNSIQQIREYFAGFVNKMPLVTEVIFWYRIMNKLVVWLYNTQETDWNIDLAQGITYVNNNFNSDNPDISMIHAVLAEWEKHFPYRFLKDIFTKLDIRDSIVIIDFFWPWELLQILMICDVLKKQWNTIIIDATNANEQFDFTQWIKVFQKHTDIFWYFDYFLIYQDYGVAMQAILKMLQCEEIATEIKNTLFLENGEVKFYPPTRTPDTEDLYEHFSWFYLNAHNIFRIAGNNGITMRLLPYKCYWSACNFCAINSTNLYTFQSDKHTEINQYIDACIIFLQKYDIYHVIFLDEAIHPDVIHSFAQKVIDRGLQIRYQFRTRFEITYTREVCRKLYHSGARYCGIGLETAIDRLEETINKGLGSIPIYKKQEIIHNFQFAGITFHNYAIFGFPGETNEESIANAYFLLKNIRNFPNYTCTPNVLSLMKWTSYYTQAQRFGIEVLSAGTVEFSLNYNFRVGGINRNFWLYHRLARKIHLVQFLPWFQETNIDPFHFWTFIDRTGLFYLMKRLYNQNPYFSYWKNPSTAIISSNEQLLTMKFVIPVWLQWIPFTDSNIICYSWVSDISIKVPMSFQKFLLFYNTDISMEENINIVSDTAKKTEILENIRQCLIARIILVDEPGINQ